MYYVLGFHLTNLLAFFSDWAGSPNKRNFGNSWNLWELLDQVFQGIEKNSKQQPSTKRRPHPAKITHCKSSFLDLS